MYFSKWCLGILTVFLFLPVGSPAVADSPSVFSAEGFFQAITRVAGNSTSQISSLITQSYPGFPEDLTRLVNTKYPKLRSDVHVHLRDRYPGLYEEALRYLKTEARSTYDAHQRDLIRKERDIAAGKFSPNHLLWTRLEGEPTLKIRVMGALDKKYPNIKFEILSRIDENYPRLKMDLFNLILSRYPEFVWDVAKIAAREAVNEFRKI